jgi:hypothetical protein
MGPVHFLFGPETSKVGSLHDRRGPLVSFVFLFFFPSLLPLLIPSGICLSSTRVATAPGTLRPCRRATSQPRRGSSCLPHRSNRCWSSQPHLQSLCPHAARPEADVAPPAEPAGARYVARHCPTCRACPEPKALLAVAPARPCWSRRSPAWSPALNPDA